MFFLEDKDIFIRNSQAISILNKILSYKEEQFNKMISANDPFGFDERELNSFKRIKPIYKKSEFKGAVKFYYNGWQKDGVGYIDYEKIII